MKYAKVVAKAVIANDQKQVLLVRRHPASRTRPGEWDLPGGKIDNDEDISAGAVREIAEETGIAPTLAQLQPVWTRSTVQDKEIICRVYYLAHAPQQLIRLSGEHTNYTWLPLDEAIRQHIHPPHQELLKLIQDRNLL
jgi:8-oxo-dGTP diphosphatase